jgi:apolipoprotein N-acyltransferase
MAAKDYIRLMNAPSMVGLASGPGATPSTLKAGVAARPMGYLEIAAWVAIATVSFHVAYAGAMGSPLILLYVFAMAQLAGASTWRQRCYSGLAVGLLIAVFRLAFFWHIFSAGSVALWYVFAFWVGLFVGVAGLCLKKLGTVPGFVLMPFLWTGLEYFRSECYYLKFSWLSPGYAFAGARGVVPVGFAGVYGVGFLLMSVAAAAAWRWRKSRMQGLTVLLVSGTCLWGLGPAGVRAPGQPGTVVRVAGIQMEHPAEAEVLARLKALARRLPDTQLVVLSEYTFNEPIPVKVRQWCEQQHVYLVVGGTAPAPKSNFYNTAFVIGPDGEIVFQQAKRVPIQFFKDGLPAPDQKVWESPWGKIGICICYDLSYRQVMDRLIRLGVQALIVPTMDAAEWGRSQHELHARIAPVRAAEYGVPIFRLASSGISQLVDRSGRTLATAPYPGDGAILQGELEIRGSGRLPLDQWLAPASTLLAGLLVSSFALAALASRFRRPIPDSGPPARRPGCSLS